MLPYRVIRFALVGVLNTLVNFLILNFSYYHLGLSKISSNIVATSCALILSFVLNRNFVFIHKGHWVKQFLLFALVTAIGTLVINNLVYIISLSLLNNPANSIANSLGGIGLKFSSDFIQINGSAVIATLFSMIWNYNGYRKIVFREEKLSEETAS